MSCQTKCGVISLSVFHKNPVHKSSVCTILILAAFPSSVGLFDNKNNNNGPNGHLFYVGGDLMMRKGMLPIIMLRDGDLRIALHLMPFWILTIWGSVHIEETVVGWRNQLRIKNLRHITPGTSLVIVAPPMPLRASPHPGSANSPSCSALAWDYLPEASPGTEPRPLARQRWHATATPLSQLFLSYGYIS